MSNDPFLNAALFNFCNKLDDGPRSDAPREPRSMEDLAWLREALAAIESPDKVLKQHLQVIEIAMGWNSLQGGVKQQEQKKGAGTDNATNDNKNNKKDDQQQPSRLKQLAEGAEEVTLDDVLDSLDYLVTELEDINMATEFCLMNGPAIVLNLLEVSAANFIAPPTAATANNSSSAGGVPSPAATTATSAVTTVGAPALAVISSTANNNINNTLKQPLLKELARNEEVRSQAAMAVAHAVQQNPKAQEAFAVAKWADIVCPMIAYECDLYVNGSAASVAPTGPVTGATVAALLHLCSCMSRENDEGAKDFIVRGGVVILEQIIANPARVSAKILRRALFLVEYFASIGISNKGLIQHAANVAMMTGPSQSLRVISSSSQTNGAVSDPIPSSVLATENDEEKNDVQRVAASALFAIKEKGGAVVVDILKPMGLGSYLAKSLPLAPAGSVPSDDVRWALAKALEG